MGHLNSHLVWHKYAEPYFREGKKILEVGPAGYPTYFEKALHAKNIKTDYFVLDVAEDFISGAVNNPKFTLSTEKLHYPFEDGTFDIVFSDQVLAHVEYFWLWYGELARITKPGGYIITINSYSYPRCPSPIDAWRVHSDGMKLLNKFYRLQTILSITESAELDRYNIPLEAGYYFPGASITKPFGGSSNKNLQINLIKRSWNRIIGKIPKVRGILMNPVNAAFDTITIAQKSFQ
ncbi:MAG TPA: methyltransferase domain-containing protein [Chitinophagaceae bacterium]|nr:methyltransferase domain-containing protein [Chitinophagaceae bacterium]